MTDRDDFQDFDDPDVSPFELEAIARDLAHVVLAGSLTERAIRWRLEKALGSATRRAQAALVRELFATHGPPPFGSYPPPHRLLSLWLAALPSLAAATLDDDGNWFDISVFRNRPKFSPSPRFAGLQIPPIATSGELAKWLGLTVSELDWFADTKRLQPRETIPILCHYDYHAIAKASGKVRLIEAPKPRLKTLQRRILDCILSKVPVHRSVHGFVSGRSCISGASGHAAEEVVATVDLADFFHAVQVRRIHGTFRVLGYPHDVARYLTDLVTTAAPSALVRRLERAGKLSLRSAARLEARHLAQGAPTSPALANLCSWRLDTRLHGLAHAYEARYTRYADDLTFSGDQRFSRRIDTFLDVVAEIVDDEGHCLNPAKTRVMRRSARQIVTGIVVNSHVNVPRTAFDRLKAILRNCLKHGPASQNLDGVADFRAHLDGRIGWVEGINPIRGGKLRRIFDRIAW